MFGNLFQSTENLNEPEQSSNNSSQNIPSDQYDELKCSFCNKYLSVAPIFMSSDEKINKCGRCIHQSVDETLFRNKMYEKLAKNIQFPCSESKKCNAKLVWGKVTEHEIVCPLRTIICPTDSCGQEYEINTIFVHFRDNHIFYSGDVIQHNFPLWNGEMDVVLIDIRNNYFLGYFAIDDDFLRINVLSLTAQDMDYKFTLGLTSKNFSINYNESQNINTYLGICHTNSSVSLKKESLIDVLKIDLDGKVVIKLEIFKKGQRKPRDNNNDFLAPLCKDIILKAIECPICLSTMSSYIYSCQTGHSICATCKEDIEICPSCRASFQNGRNYALEELYQKLNLLYPVSNDNSFSDYEDAADGE